MCVCLWGVFWNTLDLDSLTIFIGGGILGHLGFGLYDNFHFGGGILGHLGFGLSDNFHGGGGYSVPSYYRIGVFCVIWTKISTTPAGSCVTDSLSHTTYVETNKRTWIGLLFSRRTTRKREVKDNFYTAVQSHSLPTELVIETIFWTKILRTFHQENSGKPSWTEPVIISNNVNSPVRPRSRKWGELSG